MADDELAKLSDREREVRRDLDRAQRAEVLLSDELLVAAFKAIEDKVMTSWRGSQNVEDREERHRQLHTLDAIKLALDHHVRTGKLAVADLEDIKVKRGFIEANIKRFRSA